MLTGLTGQVLAQRDITNSYITNAKLDKGTSGWTVSNFSTPVQGNNTVGYASEAYAGWGALDVTSYSMTQNITLPKGSYRLVNYSFFRQGLRYNSNSGKSLAYLKAGNKQTTIKTLGSIKESLQAGIMAAMLIRRLKVQTASTRKCTATWWNLTSIPTIPPLRLASWVLST